MVLELFLSENFFTKFARVSEILKQCVKMNVIFFKTICSFASWALKSSPLFFATFTNVEAAFEARKIVVPLL